MIGWEHRYTVTEAKTRNLRTYLDPEKGTVFFFINLDEVNVSDFDISDIS